MIKLEMCPHCGGQTMLCQSTGIAYAISDFSIICLQCGMEFKAKNNPQSNLVADPIENAKNLIAMFNRRDGIADDAPSNTNGKAEHCKAEHNGFKELLKKPVEEL